MFYDMRPKNRPAQNCAQEREKGKPGREVIRK